MYMYKEKSYSYSDPRQKEAEARRVTMDRTAQKSATDARRWNKKWWVFLLYHICGKVHITELKKKLAIDRLCPDFYSTTQLFFFFFFVCTCIYIFVPRCPLALPNNPKNTQRAASRMLHPPPNVIYYVTCHDPSHTCRLGTSCVGSRC